MRLPNLDNVLMVELGASYEYPKRVFENFKSPEVLKQLCTTCEILSLLGEGAASGEGFEEFMELSRTQAKQSGESIFVLNKMLRAYTRGPNPRDLPRSVDVFMDFFFDDDLWKGRSRAPEEGEEDDGEESVEVGGGDQALMALDSFNHTIMRWSLLLEGIGAYFSSIFSYCVSIFRLRSRLFFGFLLCLFWFWVFWDF